MNLLHFPLLLVLLTITTYIRDVIQLPLYGSRIHIINIIILLIGIIIYWRKFIYDKDTSALYPDISSRVEHRNYKDMSVVFGVVIIAGLILALYRANYELFYVLQLMVFLLGIFYCYLILKIEGINQLLKSITTVLWLIFLFQCGLQIFGYFSEVEGEVTASRNGLAYIAWFTFLLNNRYSSNGYKSNFVLVLLFTVLNQVIGVYILMAAYILYCLISKRINILENKSTTLASVAFIAILTGSYFSIDLYLFYNNMTLNDLNLLEIGGRKKIPDYLGSFISRSLSVPMTLDAVINNGNIFGIGEYEAQKLKYWGYPVHNYFVSSIAITGFIGFIFSITLLIFLFKVSRTNLLLAISGIFLLSMSNDLSLYLLLCFIPLLVSSRYRLANLNTNQQA